MNKSRIKYYAKRTAKLKLLGNQIRLKLKCQDETIAKLRQGLESVIFEAENANSSSFEEILQDIAGKAKEALI